MKKKGFILFMAATLSLLFGCADTKVTVELTGPTTITVGEAVLLTAVSSKASAEFIWSSSDDGIVKVEEGIIEGISEGTATITVLVNKTQASASLSVSVVSPDHETIQRINALAAALLDDIPLNVSEDLELPTEDNASGAVYEYSTNNPEVLNNQGAVSRQSEDQIVRLTVTITLENVSLDFHKDLTVLKTSIINVEGLSEIEMGQTAQLNVNSAGGDEFVFSSSNSTILEVDLSGLITAKKAGTAVITIVLVSDPGSLVNYSVTVFDPLEVIGVYLKAAIPDEISANVEFLTSHPLYEMSVSYQTNSAFITDQGQITPDKMDRYATISINVTYQERTKTCSKSVKILMIPAATQVQNTNQWLEETVGPMIDLESGLLPQTESVYDRGLSWLGSCPGMVVNGELNPTLQAQTVNLIATYEISNRKYQYVFNYESKGVSEMDKTNFINNYMTNLFPASASNRITIPYEEEVVVTKSIVYPNTVNQMRPGTGLIGQKMPGGVKYIVIHDTGMSGANDTAIGVDQYIHAQANSLSGRVASWHYSIDDTNCFQHVPNDEIAWHAGDGSHAYGTTYFNNDYQAWCIGGGNQNGIGIETCINLGGNYQRTLRRTAWLVASLLNQYGLGLDAIKQHNDFSGKGCPAVIRSSAGRWQEFLKMVEFQLFLLQMNEPVSYTFSNDNEAAISSDGLVNQELINDTLVNLRLVLSLNGNQFVYDYPVLALGMTTSEKFSSLYLYMYNNIIPRETSQDLVLPSQNEDYEAVLSWSSSHPEYLSDTGTYHKPERQTLVTLSVTMEIGDET
ncbi:MAG TPA: hypothetical protein DD618_01605, partial [Acholeplasmatales bacterium]|nr:hypothetical protein [Acholeplasmatales bacterium]